eukprot:2338459-Rhodomonas_salina.1
MEGFDETLVSENMHERHWCTHGSSRTGRRGAFRVLRVVAVVMVSLLCAGTATLASVYDIQTHVKSIVLATAGQIASFRFTAVDVLGSSVAEEANIFAVLLDYEGRESDCVVEHEGVGVYRISFAPQAVGPASVKVVEGVPGLQISFFDNEWYLGEPVFSTTT